MMFSLAGSLLIKVTLLLVVALLVDALLRRRWVLAVAAFWNAVLLGIIVLPLATVLVPRLTLPVLPADSQRAIAGVDAAALSRSAVADHGLSESGGAQPQEPAIVTTLSLNRRTPLLVLAWIYTLGMMALLARLLAGWRAAKSLRRGAAPVTDLQWLERLDFWLSRQGLGDNQAAAGAGRVTLLESDQIDVPVALGVWEPVILIPLPLVAKATSRTVDTILVHELAHIYRADCAWQLLDRVVHAALWLHPLMWIAEKRIAFIRERACDDFAVRMVGDFRVYGDALLRIAAGVTRRRSSGLGLTIIRSSNLERRLAAIVDSDGSNRCVAAQSARRLLTAGMLFCAMALGCIGVGRADAQETSARPGPQTNGPPAARTAELIAVTWQQVPESNDKRIEQPVWRPDGERLSDAAANALLDKIKSFQTHWWNTKKDLRPLVFIYRTSTGIRSGLFTAVVLPDGRRTWGGTCDPLQDGLAKSACSPDRSRLGSWPAKVDLEVKIPLEDPRVIKTINSVPEGAVEVAEGVRWYIAKEGGIEFLLPGLPRWQFTSGVLEVRNDGIENAARYEAKIWLRRKNRPLPQGIVVTAEPKPGERTTFYLSPKIDDLQLIERVEFTRQRFRFERIKGVETHLDLLPPDS
ncbi:MAG TPA: M56 family metallopeptidase [Planctomycetaceae bacterium]|jgi:beta-lactamase regulating signal transducer with metallopeptidase domain|nr:M56 family metallopeptidase [Planctomycetaceae bacterium]